MYFCDLGEGLRSRCSCERELGIISTGKRARRTSAGVPLGRAARRPTPSALERGALIRPLARGASDTSKGAQTSSPLAKIEASLRHEGAAVHYSGVAFRSESMHASAQDANSPRKGTPAGDLGKIRGDTPEPTEGTSAILEGAFEAKHRKMTQI